VTALPERWRSGPLAAGPRRRFVVSAAFAVLTVAASLLIARRLTHSTWPL
jgi:hypothetical protein